MNKHQAVLLAEAIKALNIRHSGTYVDATFGRGGHSAAMLAELGPGGRLFAIDQDPQAAEYAAESTLAADPRFTLIHGSFANLDALLTAQHITEPIDGVLFDLGVSSPQLDQAERGFSFNQDGPLDMRMNPQAGVPVSSWLAKASAEAIADVLFRYGEERFARRIARRILEVRVEEPILSTSQLANICVAAIPKREPGKHPATRTFQAMRIYINAELESIEQALPQAVARLAPTARLVVISFHSLEDRIVKRFMRGPAVRGARRLPVEPQASKLKVLGKPVKVGAAELASNPRARSAVMRVAECLS